MALLDIGPIVDRLERLERMEGLLVEIRDALTRAIEVAPPSVVIPVSSLPADSDPDR